MNVNFGLFPPLVHALKSESGQRLRGTEKALAKKRAVGRRALTDLERWITGDDRPAAAE
jgi:methylenetetrahydrofolate--tRNA-(uracil-5-)-methyltransferase